jgi:translation initiation factor IF-2
MGKIRVQDLAKLMGVEAQDLIFKLRSIGVRVEDNESLIDADGLQAILQGRKLTPPREVILRDKNAKATAKPTPRTTPGLRRPTGLPMRPQRARTIVQKGDARIRTIPTSERPKVETPPPAAVEEAAPPTPVEAEIEDAATPAEVQAAEATVATIPEAPVEAPPEALETPPVVEEKSEMDEVPDEVPAPAPADEPEKATEKKTEDKPAPPPPKGRQRVTVERKTTPQAPRQPARIVAPPTAERRKRRTRRKEAHKSEVPAGQALSFKEDRPSGPVVISDGMTVREFAEKLGVKSKDLLRNLISRGIMANINQVLSAELAEELATELGVEAMVVSFEEEVQLAQERRQTETDQGKVSRAPVVTIMGHVDHGKTTLLDAIRKSRIVERESGGITQHIGAYGVEVDGKSIVFIDTPGHEAFTKLRARGATVTDIVILVVAADDGVMPQTLEAIDHAKAADVPIVVAVNKIDKPNAQPDRVKQGLSETGLLPEEWGGDTVMVNLSAKTEEGIPELLEMILLTAEMQELTANPDLSASGVVLEARKEVGRGIVASVLVQSGTLEVGDIFVSGATWGKVRSMMDDLGQRLTSAGPSTPVEVTGFTEIPEAGDAFQIVAAEAKARSVAEFRQDEARSRSLSPAVGRMSLEQLFHRIEAGEVKELPIILKADVMGSVEVLRDTLEKLSTEKVRVQIVRAGVGAVSTNDVILASASHALIVGFNVRPERSAAELAEKERVEIRLHTVIYELTDELTGAMTGLLEPTFQEELTGRAEVRETFRIPRIGLIAGCHVVEGSVPRSAMARLLRDNVVVYEGKIVSLRRFKDDVSEVRTGFDCGIGLDRFQDIKPGDVIESFVRKEVAPTL